MEYVETWMGKFYRPNAKEEEEWLKASGYRMIVCGFGMGWWHK